MFCFLLNITLSLEHIKNERDYFLARRVVVLLAAVVIRAVDVRRFAVVLRALVLLAAVERRALDVVLFAAVLFDLPVEDLPRSLRKSDLIRNYSLKCIKALCGKC